MKQFSRITLILFALFAISLKSCWYSGWAYEQHLTDVYHLVAGDGEDYMCILRIDDSKGQLVIIPYTVFSAGYDQNFIIAKQHPREFTTPIDKSVTNYYIIPVKDNPMNRAIGPLTLKQFEEKRKELNVPDSIKFTIEFEKLK